MAGHREQVGASWKDVLWCLSSAVTVTPLRHGCGVMRHEGASAISRG